MTILEERIVQYVTEQYIAHGQGSTVRSIAAGCGVTEGEVRLVFKANGSAWGGLEYKAGGLHFPNAGRLAQMCVRCARLWPWRTSSVRAYDYA